VPNARFVYNQVLSSRAWDARGNVAPQIEGKLLYMRTPDGAERPVRASGELPSATRALDAMPRVLAGAWDDDEGDRRWIAPTLPELRHDIDHFHLPPAELADRESWGEWHYFNVLSPDARSWAFISFIIGGDVAGTKWGGQLLVTLHERGRAPRRFSALVPPERVRFSTTDADLTIGDGSVSVRADGSYDVRSTVREEGTGAPLRLELVVQPEPRAYFPGATLLSGDLASGYAVAGTARIGERDDLRTRRLPPLRPCPGLPRSQLGRMARRDLGVGRDARRGLHAALWQGEPAGGRDRGASLRVRDRQRGLPRALSSPADPVR
jgi:hypothetical protein